MAYLRLDRLLSNICNTTRSDITRAIKRGRVTVNGEVVKKPDFKADTQTDTITLDGNELNIAEFVYIMMNKPEGVVCTTDECENTVFDVLPDNMRRREMFTVGRLDKDTTGLLIITDDGKFVHNAAHSKSGVIKRYVATLTEPLTDNDAKTLSEPMTLSDGTKISGGDVKILSPDRKTVEIGIREGKYHQIKRMAGAVGNKVTALKRVSMGEILLDESLSLGECRYLNENEIKVYK